MYDDPFSFNVPSSSTTFQQSNETGRNIVLRTSEADEIYTSINFPTGATARMDCPMCSDCSACEGTKHIQIPSPQNYISEKDSEIKNLKEEIQKLKETNAQLKSLVQKSIEQQRNDELSSPTSSDLFAEEDHDSLPLIPNCLPAHLLSASSFHQFCQKETKLANIWYRFVEIENNQVPTSVWFVKKTGRADNWKLMECNQSFVDLIQENINLLSNSYSMIDLVPQRFKSSTSELLQQIINVCIKSIH